MLPGIPEKYAAASKRLILLDYDGTLVPFAKVPSLATPSGTLMEILQQLLAIASNDVYIISGRGSNDLESWFSALPVGLIAEHGSKMRHKHAKDWLVTISNEDKEWLQPIEAMMQSFVPMCAGSFVEKKEFSLAWHYRNANPAQGDELAGRLAGSLSAITSEIPINILRGNKVIEVKRRDINKGRAALNLLQGNTYDFILAIGDDLTDEDMFHALMKTPGAITIKVGSGPSAATHALAGQAAVLPFLQALLAAR